MPGLFQSPVLGCAIQLSWLLAGFSPLWFPLFLTSRDPQLRVCVSAWLSIKEPSCLCSGSCCCSPNPDCLLPGCVPVHPVWGPRTM